MLKLIQNNQNKSEEGKSLDISKNQFFLLSCVPHLKFTFILFASFIALMYTYIMD